MLSGIHGVLQAFEAEACFRQGLPRVHGEKFETVLRNWFDGWGRLED